MNTCDFTENLTLVIMERMMNRLIELAEESINAGVEEYIQKGYITLNFNDEYDSADSDKMIGELAKKGIDYYHYRCISDSAWEQLADHLRNEGWEFKLVEVDGGKFERRVNIPSKL